MSSGSTEDNEADQATASDDQQFDPIVVATDSARDLYGIATWEPRSLLDRVAVLAYLFIRTIRRKFVLGVLVIISFIVMVVTLVSLVASTAVMVPLLQFTVLSLIPALLIGAFVWYADGTLREPFVPLAATFFLGMFFYGTAAVVNELLSILNLVPLIGFVLFHYLIVAPGEELVKLFSVRLFAFHRRHFTSVVDGAVYGAAAGLGFASIENLSYILLHTEEIGIWFITEIRARSGAGHVIWSAIAGYYLGLAKFNVTDAGPIVLKGIFIAAFFHGTHNFMASLVGVFPAEWWFGVQLLWHTIAVAFLFHLLLRYRRTYLDVFGEEPKPLTPGPATSVDTDLISQLRVLTQLHERGFLSDDEFAAKRQEIIDQF